MIDAITNITVKDWFWVQFRSYLVSFGSSSLPNGVHFTIAFTELNSEINLHVTRNIGSSRNKPKIEICRIKTEVLDDVIEGVTLSMFRMMLEPFDVEKLRKRHGDSLGFVSYDEMKKGPAYTLIRDELTVGFKQVSKIRKRTRLKIDGDIEGYLNAFASSTNLQKTILDKVEEFKENSDKPVEGGFILSDYSAYNVLRIQGKWYTIRKGIKPVDLLLSAVNPRLAKHLIWKTKRAISAIKTAESYDDVKHLNNPIRLVNAKSTNN